MGKARRWIIWGLLLLPVAALPAALILAHLWLNDHLQREISFGEFRLRMVKPVLGWNLDFKSDSVELSSPSFLLRTSKVDADLRIWQNVLSFHPILEARTDSVSIRFASESDSVKAEKKRHRKKSVTAFPNLRIPVAFRIDVGRLAVGKEDTALCEIEKILLASQGPKGVALDVAGLSVKGVSDSLARFDAASRFSARWFGKSLRYQARVQFPDGNFFHAEGERRKSDLRVGHDTLDVSLADLGDFAALTGKPLPDVQNLQAGLAETMDSGLSVKTHVQFRSPPFFRFGPHTVDFQGNLQDTSGRIVFSAKGDSGETAYLQGQFRLPSLIDADWKSFPEKISASLSGYTRNYRLNMGIRTLPGDMEIRKLKIHPGLTAEAEVKTKDSSLIKLHAAVPSQGLSAKNAPDWSAFKCTFTGKVDPNETWAHAWTDSFVSYHDASVTGEIRPGEVSVDAYVQGAKAYGAAADSLYASNVIRAHGYYLTSSRVYWKDVMWPVVGKVEWGAREKGVGRHRKVSLDFHARHPRYGYLEYAMPRRKYMEARVENVVLEKVPYPMLEPAFRFSPVITGKFSWDILQRYGAVDLGGPVRYAGEKLNLDAKAEWNSRNLDLSTLEIALDNSKLKLSGGLRLGGRQFFELRKIGLKDVRSIALEADHFDAARLGSIFGTAYPIEKGMLDGKLAYVDTLGFTGSYAVENLNLAPTRKFFNVSRLVLKGEGNGIELEGRTNSATIPLLNDTVGVKVADLLGARPSIDVRIVAPEAAEFGFHGRSDAYKDLTGDFSLEGNLALPGEAGDIKDFGLRGRVSAPFRKDFLRALALDSTRFHGRYGVAGIDTQTFGGTITLTDGRFRIPDLRAVDAVGRTVTGEAECGVTGPLQVTAKLRGEELALRWPGIEKLEVRDLDANLTLDTSGLAANAKVGKAEFTASRAPVYSKGELENITVSYTLPPAGKDAKTGETRTGAAAGGPIPQLRLKARLRNFLFQHKVGFREVQKFFRTVKVDKRKKRIKPMDVQVSLETVGGENRIETDILRMNFAGDLAVKGIYPYTLLTGEFSALTGEVGQSSQAYDVTDFDLKWQNSTMEEGRISLEGRKRLRSNCKPDTKRLCNVFIKLDGRLDEMGFTYDSDCGLNQGEAIEPTALINSVSRGCYSDEYVAGAGGANYGEAVFNFLEPAINEKLSSVGNKVSLGWIKTTQVSGIGTVVSGDTASEPIAIGVETKEKWGMSLKAKAGYHSEKKGQNPWENKIAAEWHPPLERVSADTTWKRRVRDRVTLEASIETRPEDKVIEETNNNQVRKQVGISYRYKFWNLW